MPPCAVVSGRGTSRRRIADTTWNHSVSEDGWSCCDGSSAVPGPRTVYDEGPATPSRGLAALSPDVGTARRCAEMIAARPQCSTSTCSAVGEGHRSRREDSRKPSTPPAPNRCLDEADALFAGVRGQGRPRPLRQHPRGVVSLRSRSIATTGSSSRRRTSRRTSTRRSSACIDAATRLRDAGRPSVLTGKHNLLGHGAGRGPTRTNR